MRIRTGHGPNDWTTNIPAEPLARMGGWLGAPIVTASAGSQTDPVTAARLRAVKRVAKGKDDETFNRVMDVLR